MHVQTIFDCFILTTGKEYSILLEYS